MPPSCTRAFAAEKQVRSRTCSARLQWRRRPLLREREQLRRLDTASSCADSTTRAAAHAQQREQLPRLNNVSSCPDSTTRAAAQTQQREQLCSSMQAQLAHINGRGAHAPSAKHAREGCGCPRLVPPQPTLAWGGPLTWHAALGNPIAVVHSTNKPCRGSSTSLRAAGGAASNHWRAREHCCHW